MVLIYYLKQLNKNFTLNIDWKSVHFVVLIASKLKCYAMHCASLLTNWRHRCSIVCLSHFQTDSQLLIFLCTCSVPVAPAYLGSFCVGKLVCIPSNGEHSLEDLLIESFGVNQTKMGWFSLFYFPNREAYVQLMCRHAELNLCHPKIEGWFVFVLQLDGRVPIINPLESVVLGKSPSQWIIYETRNKRKSPVHRPLRLREGEAPVVPEK